MTIDELNAEVARLTIEVTRLTIEVTRCQTMNQELGESLDTVKREARIAIARCETLTARLQDASSQVELAVSELAKVPKG